MEANDYDIFEDDLDILEIIEDGFPRKIYTRTDDFHVLDELGFYRRYRMTKETVLAVLPLIEEELEYPSDINNSVSPMNQFLTALRYYASAGYLQTVADLEGMHCSTVSRIVKRVSVALARLSPQFIKMPRTPKDISSVQRKFFDIASFPQVIGLVDGTHIKIQGPGGVDNEIFRNRKTYFSINVQAVSDADLNIQNLVVRWPGSAHDSTIFNNSQLRASFENGEFPNSILIGDGGYPVRSYFFTPLTNPRTRPQERYNAALTTRNAVERLFGVWKRRFPVLAYGIRLKLETTLPLIVACGVLHNICNQKNLDPPPPAENVNVHELDVLIANGQIPHIPQPNGNILVNTVRNNFINQYFAHM